MAKLLPPASLFHRPIVTPASPQVFTYVSDGDTNGLFYFLGRNYARFAWVNPHTAGRLTITSTDNTGGDLKTFIVDRTSNVYSTTTSPNTIDFDLGSGKTLDPNKYSYRYRGDGTPGNSASFAPVAWKIQGSNDGSSWTDIDTTSGQTPLYGTWISRTLTSGTAYRHFRFLMTGNNNNGTTHMSIGEFEIYGTFSY